MLCDSTHQLMQLEYAFNTVGQVRCRLYALQHVAVPSNVVMFTMEGDVTTNFPPNQYALCCLRSPSVIMVVNNKQLHCIVAFCSIVSEIFHGQGEVPWAKKAEECYSLLYPRFQLSGKSYRILFLLSRSKNSWHSLTNDRSHGNVMDVISTYPVSHWQVFIAQWQRLTSGRGCPTQSPSSLPIQWTKHSFETWFNFLLSRKQVFWLISRY